MMLATYAFWPCRLQSKSVVEISPEQALRPSASDSTRQDIEQGQRELRTNRTRLGEHVSRLVELRGQVRRAAEIRMQALDQSSVLALHVLARGAVVEAEHLQRLAPRHPAGPRGGPGVARLRAAGSAVGA